LQDAAERATADRICAELGDFPLAVADWATEQNASGLPRRLAPEAAHLRHLAGRAEQRDPKLAGRLSNSLGFHLDAAGDYAGARHYQARALAIMEKALGPEHPNTRTVRANLAACEAALKRTPKREK